MTLIHQDSSNILSKVSLVLYRRETQASADLFALDPSSTSGYYAGVLKVMVNKMDSAQLDSPRKARPVSQEKMQWRMLDSGRK